MFGQKLLERMIWDEKNNKYIEKFHVEPNLCSLGVIMCWVPNYLHEVLKYDSSSFYYGSFLLHVYVNLVWSRKKNQKRMRMHCIIYNCVIHLRESINDCLHFPTVFLLLVSFPSFAAIKSPQILSRLDERGEISLLSSFQRCHSGKL